MSVLVVVRHDLLRSLILRFLERMGIASEGAGNLHVASVKYEEMGSPLVVLSNDLYPSEEGRVFVQRVTANGSKVILHSDESDPGHDQIIWMRHDLMDGDNLRNLLLKIQELIT